MVRNVAHICTEQGHRICKSEILSVADLWDGVGLVSLYDGSWQMGRHVSDAITLLRDYQYNVCLSCSNSD